MNKTLEVLKTLNRKKLADYTAVGNRVEKRKQEIIAEFLNAPWQFLNLPIETAYSMLKDLGVREEDLAETYRQLIS